MTIDHKISSHLKIGLNTINSLSIADSVGGSGVTGTLMRLSPLDRAYNPDGTLNLYPLGGSIDATTYVNPLTLKTESAAMENWSRAAADLQQPVWGMVYPPRVKVPAQCRAELCAGPDR